MKVAILGAGPAGMLAAQAVHSAGHTPIIVSKKVVSRIGGAQFLHLPIQDATKSSESFPIQFILDGTGAEYTSRIYGDHPVPVLSSWHNYANGHIRYGYPLKATYERLFEKFESCIEDMTIDEVALKEINSSHDWVVSTIPRWILDGKAGPGEPDYPFREVWIKSPFAPAEGLADNTIYYNGQPGDDPMYRMSKIQGITSGEFVTHQPGSVRIIKPIRYCGEDLHPDITKVGRYGAWSKMQLAHQAYTNVRNMLLPGMG